MTENKMEYEKTLTEEEINSIKCSELKAIRKEFDCKYYESISSMMKKSVHDVEFEKTLRSIKKSELRKINIYRKKKGLENIKWEFTYHGFFTKLENEIFYE